MANVRYWSISQQFIKTSESTLIVMVSMMHFHTNFFKISIIALLITMNHEFPDQRPTINIRVVAVVKILNSNAMFDFRIGSKFKSTKVSRYLLVLP